ncbi:polysaccharide biosynthesis C-terminal domain-containing protein, partial [Candidatus Saccharibacteria bacterium]|nr:polysaccharide biosynthesis C-terminal domain-containing protein [Candidatus Saccharibacteria bacterium]
MAISTFSEYFFGMTYKLFLQAKQKTYIISIIQASTLLLSTIVMIILMNIGCSIQIVELFGALIFICRPIIQNLYVKHKYSLLRNSKTTPCKIEQQWNGLIQHIASVIHNNTDIVILTLFTTLSEVSVYSVYLLIITGVKNIVQAFNNGIDASFGHLIAIKNFKKLNEHFSKYELFYHTITTIIFICTLTLITPFVNLYTNGITDADYNRPLFAFLITLAEFIWAIRLPYSSTALAAGHFKQTQTGAIFEALINIVLSIILVFHFGIIGVTIGTLVSMFIRTIEFMYHNSKYILKRPTWKSYSWLPLIAAETTISLTIINLINLPKATNYLDWIQNAIIVTLISSFFTITTNLLVHHSVIQKIIRHHK